MVTRQLSLRIPTWRVWLLLYSIWLLAQIVYAFAFGVREGSDTAVYLQAAESLGSTGWADSKVGARIGYSFFIWPFVALDLGATGVVAAQVLLSGLAVLALVKIGELAYDTRTGFLAAGFFILYPEIQRWNFYVLTESPFITLSTVSVWLLGNGQAFMVTGGVVLLAVGLVLRANGFVPVLAAAGYGWIAAWKRRPPLAIAVGVAVILVAAPLGLPLLDTMVAREGILDHFARGTVIWGHESSQLEPPEGIEIPPDDQGRALLGEMMSRPGYSIRLFAWRIGYFFAHVRPYYSTRHNTLLVITLLGLYGLAIVGLRQASRRPLVVLLVGGVILVQAATVAMTWADWDGRFLDVVLPFVFLFSARGAWTVLDRCARHDSLFSLDRSSSSTRA